MLSNLERETLISSLELKLIDGVLMNSVYPETFFIPDFDTIKAFSDQISIAKLFVKVGIKFYSMPTERFWVNVNSVNVLSDQVIVLEGTIWNTLIMTDDPKYSFGKKIVFSNRNVIGHYFE